MSPLKARVGVVLESREEKDVLVDSLGFSTPPPGLGSVDIIARCRIYHKL